MHVMFSLERPVCTYSPLDYLDIAARGIMFGVGKKNDAETLEAILFQAFKSFDSSLADLSANHKVPAESIHDIEMYYTANWIVTHSLLVSRFRTKRKDQLIDTFALTGATGLRNQIAAEIKAGQLSSEEPVMRARLKTLLTTMHMRWIRYNELFPFQAIPRTAANEAPSWDVSNVSQLVLEVWKNLTSRTIVKKNDPQILAALALAIAGSMRLTHQQLHTLLK